MYRPSLFDSSDSSVVFGLGAGVLCLIGLSWLKPYSGASQQMTNASRRIIRRVRWSGIRFIGVAERPRDEGVTKKLFKLVEALP